MLRLLEALATPHGVDRYLELLNPMLVTRELRARVTAVHRTTPDTLTLRLRPNRRIAVRAGQHVRLSVNIDGVRRTRCYSPTTSEHHTDGHLELTVKAHPDGLVSRWLHANARPGLVVGLSEADGAFRLPEQRPDRVLLVSGGSGITPVLSMLRTLTDEGHRGEIVFLHYADSAAHVPHLAELRTLAAVHPNVRLVLVYTATGGGDLDGFFDRAHLDEVAPWFAQGHTFLCGPVPLMASVRQLFTDPGIGERLHTEDFAPAPVTPGESGGTVTFTSGTAVDNTGEPLLVQAENAGLEPEHGCRMGICMSCTRTKTSGVVRDTRTGETCAETGREIQICVSVPVGDVTIDL